MRRSLRLPSPAMVVALVALFVALGGTAYGALVITGANIRNGTVTGADIRNKSLHGRDAKVDSLGRVPIKEERLVASKLGKVRSAENADAVGGMAARRIDAFTLPNGQSRPLLAAGAFALSAGCRSQGANRIAEITIQTTANNGAVDGAQNDPDFDIGESAQLVSASAPAGTPAFDQQPAAAAIATDGTEILGQELYAGTSVLGAANLCRFGGVVWVG